MEKTVKNSKVLPVKDNKEVLPVENKKVELPVIPMTSFKGLDFEGKEITVEIPKVFMVLGKTVTSNVSFEFPFVGNPNNKDRLGKTRVIKFKVVLPQEVDIISQIRISDKYTAYALLKKKMKLKDGLPVDGKEVVSISIKGDNGIWYGTNMDSQSAIDVIGLISHSVLWSQAHKYYLGLSGRTNKGINGNSNVEVTKLESTELAQY